VKFSGRKVKALIRSKGLKSEYIARQIGITPNYLSTIFSGKRDPGIKVLEALCAILGCDPNEFFLDNK
jgi:transcriptional regulator with XRE-family HTH domain